METAKCALILLVSACLWRTSCAEPPTVSLFSLNIYSKTANHFFTFGYDFISRDANVSLICEADGVPKPSVIITDESGNQVTSGRPFRLANCSQNGVYTCTASNYLGTSQAQRRIHIRGPASMSQFSANNNRTAEVRSGDTVELRCFVDGCPVTIGIRTNTEIIAKTMKHIIPFVHEIKRVNCSHMGTYTCLATSAIRDRPEKTVNIEVKGCPVSLCDTKEDSLIMSPIRGENITFSRCLMSSEVLTSSADSSKIVVKFTRDPVTRIYWTVNIAMYNIQVKDYRTHTVRIENIHGGLDVHFTLNDTDSTDTPIEQTEHASEVSALLIALPPVCFLILVFITVGIVWYRVKGTRISRTRTQEIVDCGNGNDDDGEELNAEDNLLQHSEPLRIFAADTRRLRCLVVTYPDLKETSLGRMAEGQEAEHQQEADSLQCQEGSNTTDLHNKSPGEDAAVDDLK